MTAKELITAIRAWKDDDLTIRIKASNTCMDIQTVHLGKNGKELWLIPNAYDEEEGADYGEDLY